VSQQAASHAKLHEAYRYCRRVTNRHAKTFSIAAHFLPAHKREACYAVYAFCRYMDDIADRILSGENALQARMQQLTLWEEDMRAATLGEHRDHPVLLAWGDTVQRFHIPWEYAQTLIDGVRSDLVFTRMRTFDELEVYCYKVASVVGLMTARIFEFDRMEALEHARDLGTAMQLTNILRDVGEDMRNGRIYIPTDDLAAFGLDDDDIRAARVDTRFRSMMRFQIARARAFYARADQGIPMLHPDSQLTVQLMSSNYRRILDVIERNDYDVFTRRASLSFAAKAAVIPSLAYKTTTRRLASLLSARRAVPFRSMFMTRV
jgi:15-cis-phytoene synthase